MPFLKANGTCVRATRKGRKASGSPQEGFTSNESANMRILTTVEKLSHHGGKTFSPRWENFFIGVKKLFHHGEKTFKRDYLFLAADFAFRFLLLKMSAKELKSCCTMMPMPCVVSVFFVKYLSFIWL